jgi:5'-3' exonuclease|tara:strand:+ start:4304 stop:5131 length:828 start_codon:yes stop_codon:yes gene_type:complete
MILIDNNQIVIACAFQIIKQKSELDMNMLRHMILNSYRMYRKKFHKKYGELVICHDAGNYWRKDIFPNYKQNRKKKMKSSDVDWREIFNAMSNLREELKENLPYKNMLVDRTEADDIIAILSKMSSEEVMIVSSDKDLTQLLVHSNVKQYSPTKRDFIDCQDPEQSLIEHIIRGDSSDGIPNIFSDDDSIINENKRQTPCRANKLKQVIENLGDWASHEKWIRNQTLIDLNYIPEEYESIILKEYEKEPEGKRKNLLNYFIKYNLKNLVEHLEEF